MDELLPYDPEFRAALRYFLEEREWTATELCDRTRPSPDAPRRINPSSISDWFHKRSHPSNQALITVCRALGVSRSEFFQIGEEIERARLEHARRARRRQIAEKQDLDAMRSAVETMNNAEALEAFEELERIIRTDRS